MSKNRLEENVLIPFLEKFNQYPFCVKYKQKEYKIGDGKPEFMVTVKKPIPLTALTTSTSLALGEAYMDGQLEIDGNLYYALDHFLGQLDKFYKDEKVLKKLIFSPSSKRNQRKEVQSHYDIGNDFYRLWLDETMSYSCGYFMDDTDTLYQAQVNKVDYIKSIDKVREMFDERFVRMWELYLSACAATFHNGIVDL